MNSIIVKKYLSYYVQIGQKEKAASYHPTATETLPPKGLARKKLFE